MDYNQCSTCLQFLPADRFPKGKRQCKCCIAEQGRKYYAANKDKIAERERKYREANKDKIAERKRKYYEANKDKFAEYREANKDKRAEYERKRYAEQRGAKNQMAVFRALDPANMAELKNKLNQLKSS